MRVLFFGTYDARWFPRIRVLQEGLSSARVRRRGVQHAARVRHGAEGGAPSAARGSCPCSGTGLAPPGGGSGDSRRSYRPRTPSSSDTWASSTSTSRGAFGRACRSCSTISSPRPRLRSTGGCDPTWSSAGWRSWTPQRSGPPTWCSSTRRSIARSSPPRSASGRSWFPSASRARSSVRRAGTRGMRSASSSSAATPLFRGLPSSAKRSTACATSRASSSRWWAEGRTTSTTRAGAASNERVRWVDWVAPGDLASFLEGFDVSLGVFGTSPKATRVVPNKVFQGVSGRLCRRHVGHGTPARGAGGRGGVRPRRRRRGARGGARLAGPRARAGLVAAAGCARSGRDALRAGGRRASLSRERLGSKLAPA